MGDTAQEVAPSLTLMVAFCSRSQHGLPLFNGESNQRLTWFGWRNRLEAKAWHPSFFNRSSSGWR